MSDRYTTHCSCKHCVVDRRVLNTGKKAKDEHTDDAQEEDVPMVDSSQRAKGCCLHNNNTQSQGDLDIGVQTVGDDLQADSTNDHEGTDAHGHGEDIGTDHTNLFPLNHGVECTFPADPGTTTGLKNELLWQVAEGQ